MERFTVNLPFVGARMKKPRDFNKQKLLLQQTSETLDRIYAEVPGLLPSTGNAKFLDVKPWNSSTISVLDIGIPIPDVCYHWNAESI
jgi:hypothetical protein